MSATALFLVYPVFGDHRFNRWNIDFLSSGNKFTGNSANIFSATFTIFRSMFNGVIRIIGHFKGGTLMALLTTGLTSGFLPKTFALESPVLIFRRRDGTVVAILWMFVFGQLFPELLYFTLILLILLPQVLDLAVQIIHKCDQVFYLLG